MVNDRKNYDLGEVEAMGTIMQGTPVAMDVHGKLTPVEPTLRELSVEVEELRSMVVQFAQLHKRVDSLELMLKDERQLETARRNRPIDQQKRRNRMWILWFGWALSLAIGVGGVYFLTWFAQHEWPDGAWWTTPTWFIAGFITFVVLLVPSVVLSIFWPAIHKCGWLQPPMMGNAKQ